MSGTSSRLTQEVTVNKTELIGQISDRAGLSRRDAEAALDSTLSVITGAVRTGDPVRITGFGTFKLSERSARMGRNPQSGAPVRVKASRGMRFSAGATLKNDLNSRGGAKKAAAKKTAAKKTAAKKTTAKRATSSAKSTARRATTSAKSTAKKAATTAKSTARKATSSRSTAKKAPARKTTAKRAPAKKTTARKTTARKR
ncbi:MAG: HU family DNA-binding protein [Acidimicrobiales bacterium]